jgi:hypothetical protein
MNKFLKLTVGLALMTLSLAGITHAQAVTQTTDLNVTGVGITDTTAESVTLVWDENPSAESYTVEYGTEPVLEQGDSYNMPPEETLTNQITIDQLTPDTTYYFSVVAYGEGKLTASQEYSQEVSAVTSSSSFGITEVRVENAGAIEVEFSEKVLLPELAKNEVVIKANTSPETTLGVVEVQLKEGSENVILVNTEAQSPNTKYALEFSDKFENENGEKIAVNQREQEFSGYDASSTEEVDEAMTGLKVDSVKALNLNGMNVVELDFSSDMELDESDLSSFTIVKSNDPNQFLEIKEIKVNNQDNSKFLLVTGAQEKVTYSLIMTSLESIDKQTMSQDNSIIEFEGVAETTTDQPTDSDEVMLSGLKIQTLETGVKLDWDVPSDDKQVSEIRVYLSTDNGSSFTALKSGVDPKAGSITLSDIETNINSQLKVALVIDGQETQGQVIEFEIAETGPASTLSLILIFSIALSYYLRRKNQFALESHF